LELRVEGSGFGVQGLGFKVHGLKFRAEGLGVRVQGSRYMFQRNGFGRESDLGFRLGA